MDHPAARLALVCLTVVLGANSLWAGEIHEAAAAGHLEQVRALVEADPALLEVRDETGNTPLISACSAPVPRAQVAELLIDRGADVNAKNNWGGTPLYMALDDFDLVRSLIAKGAEVNVEAFVGITPLHQAASAGDLRVARLLIEKGARLDARSGSDGTILHQVINAQHLLHGRTDSNREMVRLLLESGSKLQEFSFGNSELHLAALTGQAHLVPLLVEHGADVSARNAYGHTPLHYAARHGYRAVAEALIARGAPPGDIGEANYGKAPQLTAGMEEGEAYLWYLGGPSPSTGYAVKTKNHLLVFDPFEIDVSSDAGLANGCLNPNELAGQRITVLLTRPRHPRFAPSPSELARRLPGAELVLGFEPPADSRGDGDVPPYHLAVPNQGLSVGGVQVFAIRATGRHLIERDSGVGYLVKADGVTVFHAGLDASSNEASQLERYRQGIDTLKPFAPIDIAILPTNGRHLAPIAYEPYLYLVDQLSPKAIYLIGEQLANERYLGCVEVLKAHDVTAEYPEGGIAVGRRFHYLRGPRGAQGFLLAPRSIESGDRRAAAGRPATRPGARPLQ